MHFDLVDRTVSLSVGEFASFSLGPQESGGGPQGLWRAQLGQHWHNELQKRTEQEFSAGGTLHPDVKFEVPINGRLTHRGWHIDLQGRIDQLLPDCRAGSPNPASAAALLREIKSVTRPLPAEESALRADYPAYFLQLAAYVVLRRTTASGAPHPASRAELVFVEAGSGLVQTVALTPFDEALVFHQLDAVVEFLNLRLRAAERRRHLEFRPPFRELRTGQENIQADLAAAFRPPSSVLLFEAPTGYGKTGCVLEFALRQLQSGRFARLVWLTGKSTGQLQVMHTLRQMTTPEVCHIMDDKLPNHTPGSSFSGRHESPGTPKEFCHTLYDKTPSSGMTLGIWQVRNKSEHCVNHTFHCVRDGCTYLRDCTERWPGSGLSRFYTDEHQPRDLGALRAAGREAGICPYEITRAALPFQDVWIGDFNYVFAPDNRGLFFERPGFDPAETLLVVDEAHNLPSRAAAARSHTATETDARLLLAELDHLAAPATLTLAVEEWIRLLATLRPAESLDPDTEAEVRHLVERLARLAADTPFDYAALGPQHSETLWSFLALHEWLDEAELSPQSKIENQKSKIQGLLWVARPGQLEFTCVDAAPAIGETLRQFGGAILMSATLQPYAEFAESCGLEMEPALRAGSARAERRLSIRPTQDPELVAGHPCATLTAAAPWRAGAYDIAVDLRVDTSFRHRANHYADTAATIAELAAASSRSPISNLQSPNTATSCVAVFFPSYAYAEAVLKTLDNYGSVLRVALQPKLPDLAAQTAWVEENLSLSDVLFLVLGSSFAEGIDLLGGRVTHAMVVGPALPEVNAVQKSKLAALDSLGRDAAFRRVYQIPGLQKVNQALGRLVRAPGQKAKVLLHCRRFAEPSYSSLLASDYQFYREITDEAGLRAWLQAAN